MQKNIISKNLIFEALLKVLPFLFQTTYPHLPEPGFSQLRIFNGHNCSLSLYSAPHNISYNLPPLSVYTKKDIQVHQYEVVTMELSGECVKRKEHRFLLEENSAISFFLDGERTHRFRDNVDKSRSGLPVVR